MAYVRTGSETQMSGIRNDEEINKLRGLRGLGHSQAACCAECAAGKACTGVKPTGDIFEFKMSSIVPWLLVFGIGYLVLKTPETHGYLAGTARSELGRARSAARGALTKYRRHRVKRSYNRRR